MIELAWACVPELLVVILWPGLRVARGCLGDDRTLLVRPLWAEPRIFDAVTAEPGDELTPCIRGPPCLAAQDLRGLQPRPSAEARLQS
jgi:hypothetical protein